MKKFFLLLFFVAPVFADSMDDIATQTARSVPSILPDPFLTPGETNPVLTKKLICSIGFHTGPYRHVTETQKRRIAKAYGLDYEATRQYVEYDHLISLELGGSNDDKNIWPEFYLPKPGAREKDTVENYLHKEVCEGRMDLAAAQAAIATDWFSVYQEFKK